MVKITRLYTDETTPELIFQQLIEQNLILKEMPIKYLQFYTTHPISKEPYHNIVIATDLPSHIELLKKSTLIFNLSEVRMFEYVNLIQRKMSEVWSFRKKLHLFRFMQKMRAEPLNYSMHSSTTEEKSYVRQLHRR